VGFKKTTKKETPFQVLIQSFTLPLVILICVLLICSFSFIQFESLVLYSVISNGEIR
jgi:predicted permease